MVFYDKGWYLSPGTWMAVPAPPNSDRMAQSLGLQAIMESREADPDFWIQDFSVHGVIYELGNACAMTDPVNVDILTFYSKVDLTGDAIQALDVQYHPPGVHRHGLYVMDLYNVVEDLTLLAWKQALMDKYPGYKVVDYHHAVVPQDLYQKYDTQRVAYGEDFHCTVYFRPTVVWAKAGTKRCGVQWYVTNIVAYEEALDPYEVQIPEAQVEPEPSLPEWLQSPDGSGDDSVPTTEIQVVPDSQDESEEFRAVPADPESPMTPIKSLTKPKIRTPSE